MSSAPANWRTYSLKIAAVGVGSVVGGPLGAALGGAFGGLFGEQAAKLLEEYTRAGGEKLSEFGVHYCYDQLCEIQKHPALESALKDATRDSLKELLRGLDLDQRASFADWFENWDLRLSESVPIEIDSLSDVAKLLAVGPTTDQAAVQLPLDQLFRETMERLDGETRAKQCNLSIRSERAFRTLPDELLQLLTDRLPVALDARIRELVALPEYRSAWIAVNQGFQDYARSTLARILQNANRILQIQERQLTEAQDQKRIAQQEAISARLQTEEYVEKYTKPWSVSSPGTKSRENPPFRRSSEPVILMVRSD